MPVPLWMHYKCFPARSGLNIQLLPSASNWTVFRNSINQNENFTAPALYGFLFIYIFSIFILRFNVFSALYSSIFWFWSICRNDPLVPNTLCSFDAAFCTQGLHSSCTNAPFSEICLIDTYSIVTLNIVHSRMVAVYNKPFLFYSNKRMKSMQRSYKSRNGFCISNTPFPLVQQ